MAEPTLADKLAEYEKLSASSPETPEAGAMHYLKRGALQGISALADVVPNLYNLGKAAAGVTFRAPGLEVGEPNPIANFLLREYGLNEPATPSPSIGGKLGAAVLEGAGAAASQGPMGLVRGASTAMAK